LRHHGSGRTGGTNAGRAGGVWVGVATGVTDALKALVAVLLSRVILPGHHWAEALAGVAAVLGHNYSVFLVERIKTEAGTRLHFRGGAGGAPTVGAAAAFWLPSLLIVLPAGALVFLFIGYASVTTLVGGLAVAVLFTLRALMGLSSWSYAVFGYVVLLLLFIALRPNLERLRNGTERLVGLRAWLKERNSSSAAAGRAQSAGAEN
jgi:glycerol-3-phosphate acyltransferase PlsY